MKLSDDAIKTNTVCLRPDINLCPQPQTQHVNPVYDIRCVKEKSVNSFKIMLVATIWAFWTSIISKVPAFEVAK